MKIQKYQIIKDTMQDTADKVLEIFYESLSLFGTVCHSGDPEMELYSDMINIYSLSKPLESYFKNTDEHLFYLLNLCSCHEGPNLVEGCYESLDIILLNYLFDLGEIEFNGKTYDLK